MNSDTETAQERLSEKTPQAQNGSNTSHNEEHAFSQKTRWALSSRVKDMHDRDKASGLPDHKLGITWNNLTVEAISAGAALHENVVSQFNVPKLISESRHKAPLRTILSQSHGCVKPGEMLLVLGRPGSGCTTLLNLLANKRKGYANISGDVHYGSMTAKEAQSYRGQIVMNSEEEIFFPTLTVGQTIDFATRLKIPHTLPNGVSNAEELRLETKDFLLKSMNIEHTNDTKVGNEYVRGVSGGERKRVSILETMATRGSVYCWDNSTRGLDANTALEYTKCIRAMTDILGLSSIVTLYQAGNGIYDLFDKVLVLDEGKEVFYGTRDQARPFMESLGFVCSDGANVGDYLTGVTVPTERKIKPGFERTFPRTADALLAEYEKTTIRQQMATEYEYHNSQEAKDNTAEFQSSVVAERHPKLPKSSPYTTSFFAQIWAVVARQYQIIWGDKVSFFIKQILTIVQAFIAGSLFYNAPDNSGGLFVKGGACFFTLLYPLMVAQSETTDSFTGRPVLLKHKGFAYFHPATFVLAQIASDVPVVLFQTISLTVIVYWMVGLTASAGAFFTYFVVTLATTLCVVALFRAIGAGFKTFDGASKASGFLIAAMTLYCGYPIAKPKMHPWFVWIFWINPMSYAFDALLSNELHGKVIPCVGTNLIPFGPGYGDDSPQACAGIGGGVPRQDWISGDDYLSSLSYAHSHIWRNFGVVLAFWALFVALTAFFVTNWKSVSEDGPALVIPRENSRVVAATTTQRDEEGQANEKFVRNQTYSGETTEVGETTELGETTEADEPKDLVRNTSVFTWKNLSYTVKTPSGDRVLLDNVQGWVKPGMLGALMGSSGAGKTTLLDVLAQRKTDGTIRGSIMVDGRDLPVSFQRSIGYCEQLDIFEPLATVREALEFSALLRQNRETPKEEKLKYVDTIIDLLELHDLADTLIGRPGAGLTVEQRKRVTIGVELVSKPSILIFLDEPTSGLDGQSAFNTVRFLKKLAAVGQAVLVTIHQPSAQLFYQFDSLLLLAKGGKTVYFGDIGEQPATVKEYFAKNGAPCPDEVNPAEHMIDVVSGSLSQNKDWNQVWLQGPEYTAMTKELDRIIDDAASKPPGSQDDVNEFAMPLWYQTKLVTHRMNVSLFRNTDYVNNKVVLHIFSALFNGFTFWMIGDSVSDLQLCLFTVFSFIFVAPGTIAQLQPLFIQRRDIFEAREKKSKMYSWVAFVTGLIVSEIPYLVICAVFYFVCWYYTVGFPNMASRAGSIFFVMFLYEFLYTGMGQFVAAYAPNEVAAALVNPIIIGMLVSFCGVLLPYSQIQEFWRYWMYYLDPFNYVMGSMLVFGIWGKEIKCSRDEFAVFDPPSNSTCRDYLSSYLSGDGPGMFANLINPDATEGCRVCSYSRGEDYLSTLNLGKYLYGWRDAGIVAIFVFSSYALVYALMKLRTKTSKKAE